jgi:acyl-CoA reductase-like NAD-dependent aldehyde dehydrogenase
MAQDIWHKTAQIAHTQLFIDGEEVAPTGGREYGQFNPARPTELVGHAAMATVEDVDRRCARPTLRFPPGRRCLHRAC